MYRNIICVLVSGLLAGMPVAYATATAQKSPPRNKNQVPLAISDNETFSIGSTVDVTKFDILGVKLGMTAEEAINALRERGFINIHHAKQAITKASSNYYLGKFSDTEYEVIVAVRNVNDTPQTPPYVIHQGGVYMDIDLVPQIKEGKPGPAVVARIKYITRSDDIFYAGAALAEAAIKKYGAPTITRWPKLLKEGKSVLEWCDDVNKTMGRCSKNSYLQQATTELLLETTRYGDDYYIFKDQEAKRKVTRPDL